MYDDAFEDEFIKWNELSGLLGRLTSTVEEYSQYPSRGISRIPDRSRGVFVEQKTTPLRIGWRDEDGTDLFDVELKAKGDGVREKQSLLGNRNRLIYCPKTWQISEIKFYHDLPTTAIQIAWPADDCAIVPILDSFGPFLKLRYMIWDYALSYNPRYVKLSVDRRYRRPIRGDRNHLVKLSCQIRQHGPLASKLPIIALLYACQESHLLFMKKYTKMNISVPVQRCDLNLRAGPRRKKTVDCEIRVDRKGYINFRQDTLMIGDFRQLTGILWDWNLTTLDLSLVESFAVHYIPPRRNAKPYYGGKKNLWELLETRCPSLKRLSLVVGRGAMEDRDWSSDQQPVARILPINAEFVDGVTYGFQVSCHDEYVRTTGQHALAVLKIRHRTLLKDFNRELRANIRDAKKTKSSYYQQVERNPSYWKKVDVNLAYVS
ncbi:hypothetical protein EAE96_008323 [Botrytis aclada]|nr:hypothetical protein EAE96_008323 [Botrytis aclada]